MTSLRSASVVIVCILGVCPLALHAQQAADWGTQADSLRGNNGQQFSFRCPGGGQISSRLWGTDVYTDDSSICTAAVHAGLISTAGGGTVRIEIRPGAGSYLGSTRNGVTSNEYGAWHGSFVFITGVQTPTQEAGASATAATWATQADSLRGKNGQHFSFRCPAGGQVSSRLWGTDVYTDDSSICTAAVHAGLISTAGGGTITVEIQPGQSSYRGSSRNGVTSNNYGRWDGSFAFLLIDAVPPEDMAATSVDWGAQANGMRGKDGQRFSFRCPGGGALSSRLWGTDVYTDDSSICTAAVHAGLITVARGGTVAIEIRPGQGSYRGTSRNGVNSSDYGAWRGSFVFVSSGLGEPLEDGAANVQTASWATQADSLRGKNGQRFSYRCPGGGQLSSRLWGTDTYTDDSSVCTAAAHAGLITASGGGTVTIEIRAGASSYLGSVRNGATSNDYGSWGGSFVFIRPLQRRPR